MYVRTLRTYWLDPYRFSACWWLCLHGSHAANTDEVKGESWICMAPSQCNGRVLHPVTHKTNIVRTYHTSCVCVFFIHIYSAVCSILRFVCLVVCMAVCFVVCLECLVRLVVCLSLIHI